MTTTPVADLDPIDNDRGDVDRLRTLDLLRNFISAEPPDSSPTALGEVSDDGGMDVLCKKLSLTNVEVNSGVGSSGFHVLPQTQNLLDGLDGSRSMPLTISAGNPNDGSSGFGGRLQTNKSGIDINTPAVSCELSLSISGILTGHGSSSSQSRVQKSRPGFEPMTASHELSRTTSLVRRRKRPSPEPPVIASKKKYFRSNQPHFDPQPYILPEAFRQHINSLGGEEVKLVTQKALTCSDLSPHLARLLLPENQFVRGEHFLRPGEIEYLRAHKDNKIDVGVVSSKLEETTLKFNRWSMGKNRTAVSQTEASYYVIHGCWIGFARENKLKEKDRVQLWSFRIGSRDHRDSLKIAMVNLDGTIDDPMRA